MRTFLTLLVMTSLIWTVTEGIGNLAQCARFGDGCSIPGNADFFFKEFFTPSCRQHDACYDCGATFRLSRLTCDARFRDSMMNACAKLSQLRGIACKATAEVYYKAVRAKGEPHFHQLADTALAYCMTLRTTVKSCLGATDGSC